MLKLADTSLILINPSPSNVKNITSLKVDNIEVTEKVETCQLRPQNQGTKICNELGKNYKQGFTIYQCRASGL